MNDLPIIRLTIEGMKQSMLHAFSAKQLDISSEVKRAIEDQCSQEKIQAYVDSAAREAVQSAVTSAIKHWWLTSPEGRKLIQEAITQRMEQEASFYKRATGEQA